VRSRGRILTARHADFGIPFVPISGTRIHFSSVIARAEYYIAPVKEGKVRALGMTTANRSEWLPDVPSIAESLPGYDVSSWYGICGPVGLDKAIQKKIETDVLELLTQPKLKQRLTDMGVIVEPLASAAFTEFFRAATARWAKLAREAGIEPQ
jgi:tripartite-type tricarboxylate transporter receptor subunit TctC